MNKQNVPANVPEIRVPKAQTKPIGDDLLSNGFLQLVALDVYKIQPPYPLFEVELESLCSARIQAPMLKAVVDKQGHELGDYLRSGIIQQFVKVEAPTDKGYYRISYWFKDRQKDIDDTPSGSIEMEAYRQYILWQSQLVAQKRLEQQAIIEEKLRAAEKATDSQSKPKPPEQTR
ncbi:MAG: hypothetical protein ACLQVY_13960 [Limisphaerales bacterium]